MSNRWKIALLLGLGVVVAGAIGWVTAVSPTAEQLAQRAEQALKSGDNQQAEALSRMALARDPQSVGATRVNILALIRMHEYEPARVRLRSLAGDEAADEISLEAAREFFQHGRLSDALAFAPHSGNAEVNQSASNLRLRVASLCGDWGRLRELLEHDDSSPDFRRNVLLAFWPAEPDADDLAVVEKGAANSPADPLALTALSRQSRTQNAQDLIDQALRIDPDIAPAMDVRAQLLAASASKRDWDIFVLRLPTPLLSSAAIWESFGDRCAADNQPREAARCYYESIKLQPRSESVFDSLLKVIPTGEFEHASQATEELKADFASARNNVATLRATDTLNESQAIELAARLTSLGRTVEATHWRQLAGVEDPSAEQNQPSEAIGRLQKLEELPLPEWVIRRQQQRRK